MPIIPPEVIAMARVKVTPYRVGPTNRLSASYEFSNGFDVAEVTGAVGGSPPIGFLPDNSLVLFLSEAVAPGSVATVSPAAYASEGGLKARVDVVRVSSQAAPSPFQPQDPFIEARWYYGNYDLASVMPLTNYTSVDPKKAIVVSLFFQQVALLELECVIDVVVFRNVMTAYKPPVIYGTLVPVVVYPP